MSIPYEIKHQESVKVIIDKLNSLEYDYDKFASLKDWDNVFLNLPKFLYHEDSPKAICYEEILLEAYICLNRNIPFKVLHIATIYKNQRLNDPYPYKVKDHLHLVFKIHGYGWVLLAHSDITDPGSGWVIADYSKTYFGLISNMRNYYKNQHVVKFSEVDVMPLLMADVSTINYGIFLNTYLESIRPIRRKIKGYNVLTNRDGHNEVVDIVLDDGSKVYFN